MLILNQRRAAQAGYAGNSTARLRAFPSVAPGAAGQVFGLEPGLRQILWVIFEEEVAI
jgi:hypothetical protein